MVSARGPLVVTLYALALVLGCGPGTRGEESGADGSGTGSSAGSADASGGASLDDTSGAPGICGDGVLDPDEACDDGNEEDADGCSHRCELSGSSSWSLDLSTEPYGFAVALDVRDGHAYAGVQQHDQLAFDMSVSRVSREGVVVAEFFDPGGLSDVDLARHSIASMPDEDFIAGYFVGPDRSLARIDFDEGISWTASPEGGISFATMWSPSGVFVLRSRTADDELVVSRFSEQGELVGELPLGLSSAEYRPLGEGAMLARPLPTVGVLTQSDEGTTYFSSAIIPATGGATADAWSTVELGASPPGSRARAFAHPVELVVWTEQERIVIDMLDHFQGAEPRVVPGLVLVSFESGFAIVEGQRIDVHDDQGALRWSHDPTLTPRHARVDGDGGMFVLSDDGPEGSTVHLEYLVL